MLILLATLSALIRLLTFMILCPLSQNPNNFLLYKTCIFELKSNFLFTVTKKNGLTVYRFFKDDFILNLCDKIN